MKELEAILGRPETGTTEVLTPTSTPATKSRPTTTSGESEGDMYEGEDNVSARKILGPPKYYLCFR